MTFKISFTTLLSFCFFLTLSAQTDAFDKGADHFDNSLHIYPSELIEYNYKYEEDLLIARRDDQVEAGAFAFRDSTEFYYNNNDLLDNSLNLKFDNGAWNNWKRTEYEYDSNNNRTLFHRLNWNNSEWISDYQYRYEYDVNNYRSLQTRYSFENGDWVPSSKTEYVHEDDKLIQFTQLNYIDNNWVNNFDYHYYYNTNGNLDYRTTHVWVDTEWILSRQTIYVYDENNNVIEADRREWYEQTWVPNIRFTYKYNSDNQEVEQLREIGPTGEYVNNTKIEFTYHGDGLKANNTFYFWTEEEWAPTASTEFSYDDRENIVYTLSLVPADDDWANSSQAFLYYRYPSPTSNPSLDDLMIKIVPNPNDGNFTINIQDQFSDKHLIELFSMDGKSLFSKEIENNTSVNLNFLPDGTYLLKMTDGNRSLSKKLLIQH